MSQTIFNPHWENNIYSQNQQLNRYPYDSVVSFVYRFHPRNIPISDTKIIEVGCGSGNNLWFAAREGFQVSGIDGSKTAIDFAKNRFKEEKLSGDFIVGDFTNLPYEDNHFQIAIDRGSITCVPLEYGIKAIEEAYRVLAPGGLFFSNLYSVEHTSFTEEESDGNGFCANITQGTIRDAKATCFYNEERMKKAFGSREWVILSKRKIIDHDFINESYGTLAQWIVIARKGK